MTAWLPTFAAHFLLSPEVTTPTCRTWWFCVGAGWAAAVLYACMCRGAESAAMCAVLCALPRDVLGSPHPPLGELSGEGVCLGPNCAAPWIERVVFWRERGAGSGSGSVAAGSCYCRAWWQAGRFMQPQRRRAAAVCFVGAPQNSLTFCVCVLSFPPCVVFASFPPSHGCKLCMSWIDCGA